MWLYDFLIFYNSGKAILAGISPYHIYDFNSPIFLAIFFAPLAILPVGVAYGTFIAVNIFLAWKLLKKRMVWAFLFFPFLFSLFVGQIDFLLASLILVGSPWTIGLALIKPQVAFVIVPWMIMSFGKKDWIKAGASILVFTLLSFIIQPQWVFEWLATKPEFIFFSSHASNIYWLIPQTHLDIRAKVTIILAIIILPLGFLLKNRKDSWTLVHLFAPLTNLYSPAILIEWIGPVECLLSWIAVIIVKGDIHLGMPFFIIGFSIIIRSVFEKRTLDSQNKENILHDYFRPFVFQFIKRITPRTKS